MVPAQRGGDCASLSSPAFAFGRRQASGRREEVISGPKTLLETGKQPGNPAHTLNGAIAGAIAGAIVGAVAGAIVGAIVGA